MSPTAAGTWINLQDAYTVEATNVGTWSQIGYNAPGTQAANGSSSNTNNFGYQDAISNPGTASAKATWTATALHKLNDCDKGNWIAEATSQSDSDAGTTYVKIETKGTPQCTGLTPSFTALARSTD